MARNHGIGPFNRHVWQGLWLCASVLIPPSSAAELLSKTSFETGWVPNSASTRSDLGTIVYGKKLALIPKPANSMSTREAPALGVVQGIATAPLRGKSLYISSRMKADPGSIAVLRIYAVQVDGSFVFQETRQGPAAGDMAIRRDMFVVPADPRVLALLVECAVEGTTGAAYFADVSLSEGTATPWLEAAGAADPGAPYEAVAEVDAARRIRTIPSSLFGTNLEWPWDGLGAWNPAANAPNEALVSLSRRAGLTLYRFPGGVFADFYHWRQAVGPASMRPTAEILPGGGLSPNGFGTDEALAFARDAGGELMITVNVVTGTPRDAADWVAHVNKASRRVRYWELGNESYATGTSGPIAAASLTPEQYASRVIEFARAMRAVDPEIRIGAIADENFSRTALRAHADWTGKLLRLAGGEIDFLSLHCAYAPVIWTDRNWDTRTVYAAMLAAPALIAEQLADVSRRVEAAAPEHSHRIKFAITEWGPLFQMDPGGRFTDHAKTLASAIFTASALRSFIQEPRVEIANFFKLVDVTYQGSTGYRHGAIAPNPSLYALELFARNFGPELVASSSRGPEYDSPGVGWVDSVSRAPYLELLASTSADGRLLYILAINKHFDRAIRTQVKLHNFRAAGTAGIYTLNGTAADSHTGVQWLFGSPARQAQISPVSGFYSGAADDVRIGFSSSDLAGDAFEYTFAAHSVTSIVLRRE